MSYVLALYLQNQTIWPIFFLLWCIRCTMDQNGDQQAHWLIIGIYRGYHQFAGKNITGCYACYQKWQGEVYKLVSKSSVGVSECPINEGFKGVLLIPSHYSCPWALMLEIATSGPSALFSHNLKTNKSYVLSMRAVIAEVNNWLMVMSAMNGTSLLSGNTGVPVLQEWW